MDSEFNKGDEILKRMIIAIVLLFILFFLIKIAFEME